MLLQKHLTAVACMNSYGGTIHSNGCVWNSPNPVNVDGTCNIIHTCSLEETTSTMNFNSYLLVINWAFQDAPYITNITVSPVHKWPVECSRHFGIQISQSFCRSWPSILERCCRHQQYNERILKINKQLKIMFEFKHEIYCLCTISINMSKRLAYHILFYFQVTQCVTLYGTGFVHTSCLSLIHLSNFISQQSADKIDSHIFIKSAGSIQQSVQPDNDSSLLQKSATGWPSWTYWQLIGNKYIQLLLYVEKCKHQLKGATTRKKEK